MTAPTLRVVHGGEPSAEEVAALVVALVATAATTDDAVDASSRWRHSLRATVAWQRGGWVAAARRRALRAGR